MWGGFGWEGRGVKERRRRVGECGEGMRIIGSWGRGSKVSWWYLV